MKKIVIDLDGTLTKANTSDYKLVLPRFDVVEKLREYHKNGFKIVIATARNMRTYNGNIGEINIHTIPIITEWLEKHNIPYDELIVGKTWCGEEGFYIDDRAVRPSEFAKLSYEDINSLLEKDKQCS